jgi:hypothetical protein
MGDFFANIYVHIHVNCALSHMLPACQLCPAFAQNVVYTSGVVPCSPLLLSVHPPGGRLSP